MAGDVLFGHQEDVAKDQTNQQRDRSHEDARPRLHLQAPRCVSLKALECVPPSCPPPPETDRTTICSLRICVSSSLSRASALACSRARLLLPLARCLLARPLTRASPARAGPARAAARSLARSARVILIIDKGGIDLYEFIDSRPKSITSDEEVMRHVVRRIVDALEHCHRRGVVHRDLKASLSVLFSSSPCLYRCAPAAGEPSRARGTPQGSERLASSPSSRERANRPPPHRRRRRARTRASSPSAPRSPPSVARRRRTRAAPPTRRGDVARSNRANHDRSRRCGTIEPCERPIDLDPASRSPRTCWSTARTRSAC